MDSQAVPVPPDSLWRRSLKPLLATAAAALLTACMGDSFYPPAATSPAASTPSYSPEPSAAASAAATPAREASPLAREFSFPQASCGDRANQLNSTWYLVFVDRADVEEIRQMYCADAISTVRDRTGVASVQVASFTSSEKALRFAKLVGGEVESTDGQVTSTATNASPVAAEASPSAQPAPSPTTPADRSPAADAATALRVGQSAFITAKDAKTPVNIRERASVASAVQRIGYAGDAVRVADSAQGDDSYTWYHVRFESGVEGWIRGDFLSKDPPIAQEPDRPTAAPLPYYAPPSAAAPQAAAPIRQLATLTGSDPNSIINVRERASTASRIRYMGYSGDAVRISNQVQGDDGYTWYNVQFDSGASGWVRSDFVQVD